MGFSQRSEGRRLVFQGIMEQALKGQNLQPKTRVVGGGEKFAKPRERISGLSSVAREKERR
jgi:hypothetical protein